MNSGVFVLVAERLSIFCEKIPADGDRSWCDYVSHVKHVFARKVMTCVRWAKLPLVTHKSLYIPLSRSLFQRVLFIINISDHCRLSASHRIEHNRKCIAPKIQWTMFFAFNAAENKSEKVQLTLLANVDVNRRTSKPFSEREKIFFTYKSIVSHPSFAWMIFYFLFIIM